MVHIRELTAPPPNLDAFVREIADELQRLYGAAAAERYRLRGRSVLQATLMHPAVSGWGAFLDGVLVGLLFTVVRSTVGELSFMHVLRSRCAQSVEDRLAQEAVNTLRAGGVEGITSDFVPACPLAHHQTMLDLGFEHIPRQLMRRPLPMPAPPGGPAGSRPLHPADWASAADCLAEAYAQHPGRRLHAEVRSREEAADFFRRTVDGAYGPVRPESLRGVFRGNTCVALALGCEASADTGFVLQFAVHPEARGQGLGTRLLHELLAAFGQAGLANAALGVSMANPARRLYARVGFQPFREIDAYAWWRGELKETLE